MNTIPEVPSTEATAADTTRLSEVLHTSNGATIFSSSTSSSFETTVSGGGSSSAPAGQANGSDNAAKTDANGNADAATTSAATAPNGIDRLESLKIIGHLKSIEQINEKRRVFLSNTISEVTTSTSEQVSKVETERIDIDTANNNKNNNSKNNNNNNNNNIEAEEATGSSSSSSRVANGNGEPEAKHIATPEDFDITTPTGTTPYATPQSLRTPTSPAPPKPPMLSRTRSLPRSASLASPPPTPLLKSPADDGLPAPVAATTTATTTPATTASTVTITSATVAEPLRVTTVQLHDAPKREEQMPADVSSAKAKALDEDDEVAELPTTEVQRRKEPAEATRQPQLLRPISAKHYERIIEELKCPGCAHPMKGPVYLCCSGHSICGQCTRVLMMCPLCKEPFTKLRSLTVEALCSKAHFRCSNAEGGCTVRMHHDLLSWHEKQCIYKPMKCFMGRVWGDCQWHGREAYWKDHLEQEHGNKVFRLDNIDLIWNMGVKQKPLTGYYVFEVYDEMFNFYEIYDKERVLFTMTVTSTTKEKKYNFAYEVTMLDRDSDAISITQKFPVHSEYDNDILQEGTCVSVSLTDLAKFIDDDRLLHYRVRIVEIKTPRKTKASVRHSCPANSLHPQDFQQTQIAGVNLKSVPTDVIVTRKLGEILYADSPSNVSPSLGQGGASSSEDELEKIRRRYNERHESDGESDPELDAFIAKRWGTPQLHFNRKYLRTAPSDISSDDAISQQQRGEDTLGELGADGKKATVPDDRVSISSTSTNYRKRMTNTLRRSMRTLKVDFKALTTKKPSDKQPESA